MLKDQSGQVDPWRILALLLCCAVALPLIVATMAVVGVAIAPILAP